LNPAPRLIILLAGAGYAVAGAPLMTQWISVARATAAAPEGDSAICLSTIYIFTNALPITANLRVTATA
jgi:hypothetical protein